MTNANTTEYASHLDHIWDQLEPLFRDFHDKRDLPGLWKQIMQGKLAPDIHPDLKIYAQGLVRMAGYLREDFRILKQLHTANPTLIDTRIRGSSQTARNLERDMKLVWASWWDNDLNEGRIVDSRNYEGQIGLGQGIEREKWCPKPDEEGNSPCPFRLENVLVDTMWWQGDFRNPDVAIQRYSVSVIDCDLTNSKGERPSYTNKGGREVLGWVSQDLPREDWYAQNAQKKVDIIVMDAVDYLAMCPLPGCTHRKRRITTYICEPEARADDYEQVDCSDSPFEKCSFVITGGDVCDTERDPHEILRPSAWILIDLVNEHNMLWNSLLATFSREMADDRLVVNMSGVQPDVAAALVNDQEGGEQEIKKPEIGSRTIARMPGAVQMLPKPSTTELMQMMRDNEAKYMLYRPNPNLTGQAAVSEVTGTAATLNKQGAGQMLQANLTNWDTSHKRFFLEAKHAICFTAYMDPDMADTRYIGIISGRENVKGSKGEVGEELYLDAKKCAHSVSFNAETSADTPQDRRDREERARTAEAAGIFYPQLTYEAYGIQDIEAHEEQLERARIRKQLEPWADRRIMARLMAKSAAVTGVDHGEEVGIANMPPPEPPDTGGPQSYNTLDANAARVHAPPVTLTPTGGPTGGSSGLG